MITITVMELAGIFMLPLFTQFGFQKIHILNIKFGIGHAPRYFYLVRSAV